MNQQGNCNVFKDLSHELEKYNIQIYGLAYSKQVPDDSIQSISKFYLHKIIDILKNSNSDTIILGAYSFGGLKFRKFCKKKLIFKKLLFKGLIATEMCRQLEFVFERNTNIKIEQLIMFESSHKIFHLGSFASGKQFGVPVSNGDLFKNPNIYCGTLAMYLSTMINCGTSKRVELYLFLIERSPENVDHAIQISFDFIEKNSLYSFKNHDETIDMRYYLKSLLCKSKVGLEYEYDTKFKLNVQICFFKTDNFLFKKHMNEEVFYIDSLTGNLTKFQIDSNDFSLKEILKDERDIKIIKLTGNHWNLLTQPENVAKISNTLKILLNPTKSKI